MNKFTILAVAAFLVTSLACTAEQRDDRSSVTVVSTEMRFGPERIHVRAGSKVRLQLHNQGAVLHDLNVQLPADHVTLGESRKVTNHAGHHEHHHPQETQGADNNLHLVASPGQHDTIEFVPTRAGVYRFYCSVPGHRSAGMEGELVVE